MSKPIHKRTALLNRSLDGVSEMITGRIQGPWVVQARLRDHCHDIQVIIQGGKKARSGINTGDRSDSLAGDDWRPLFVEAVTEMQFRTERPISIDCTQIYGVAPRVDFESDEGVDDSEYEAIADELADILSELAAAPLPPQID